MLSLRYSSSPGQAQSMRLMPDRRAGPVAAIATGQRGTLSRGQIMIGAARRHAVPMADPVIARNLTRRGHAHITKALLASAPARSAEPVARLSPL
jgi:hypothetical protein